MAVGRLRPTHRQIGSPRYRQPGGAWNVPTLDVLGIGAGGGSGGIREVADSGFRFDRDALTRLIGAAAGGLRSAGVRRGDTVAWQLPNCTEAVVLFGACWRLGAVAVPIHHLVGSADVARMLEALAPKVAFSRPGLPLSERAGVRHAAFGEAEWEALLGAPPVPAGPARGSDVAVGLFTSGSTGEPKVVLHTHRALSYKAITLMAAHGLDASDAVLTPAPLSHISGLLSGVLIPAAAGMRVTLMERWDPEQGIDIVRRELVTFMAGPPTFFSSMANAATFSTEAVASMRLLSCGSMTVSPDFVRATAEAFGASVKRTYGSTEAPNVTTSTWDDPPERARETDGRAVGQVELRVADPDTGRPRDPGAPGELLLRGPELFCGYSDPAQTAAAMRRGWYRTGDLATVDRDGWLTITGRLKELIIRGGENIVPAEVERVLEAHPAIVQAVVVGYLDERLGQRVAACVISRAPFDVKACQDWFSAQGVARFKTPERIVMVDALPLLSLGKPDRKAVRALVDGAQ
jgi:acyl-CoA synthetase (AMP-forming)/AMP-acid ligase II